MTITLAQVTQHLQRWQWQYHLQEEENCIITGVKTQNDHNLGIVIRLLEDGRYLEMSISNLFPSIAENVYKGVIFQTLLTICQETKLVRPAYSPMTGKLQLCVDIALEEKELSDSQFDRYLNSLVAIADGLILPRLQQVAATGIDPEQEQWGEDFLCFLEKQVPAGFLQALEKALLARHQKDDQ
jgi:hypothetical protein